MLAEKMSDITEPLLCDIIYVNSKKDITGDKSQKVARVGVGGGGGGWVIEWKGTWRNFLKEWRRSISGLGW